MRTSTDANHDPPAVDDAPGAEKAPGRPLVVALGDVSRHDFGVGSAVLDHLRGRGLPATLVSCDGVSSSLGELCRGRDLAIIIDPVSAEPCHPGRVHRLVIPPHGPGRLIVFAVEAGETSDGRGLTPPVAAAARRVADAIAAEIG